MIDSHETRGTYPTISHRVAAGYLRFLADCPSGAAQNEQESKTRQDLHGFFSAFYASLYQQPDLFGLPLRPDDCIEEDQLHEKEKKQDVTAKMKAPKEQVTRGLDFLLAAGVDGHLDGDSLVLAEGSQAIKQSKIGRKFLQGLETAGLTVATADERVTLHNSRFPAMMPALQVLANACARYPRHQETLFHFARCDFRALQPGFCPQPMDFYRETAGADLPRLTVLHEFFTGLGYHTIYGVSEPFYWSVEYQGDRKIKATPLLQVEYQERFRNPVRVFIKCVSSGRLAALLPHQSQALQDDFMRRDGPCQECGWCHNNKTLGPVVVQYKGEEKTICWYSFAEVPNFDDRSVELLQEYARMHAELV